MNMQPPVTDMHDRGFHFGDCLVGETPPPPSASDTLNKRKSNGKHFLCTWDIGLVYVCVYVSKLTQRGNGGVFKGLFVMETP